MKLYRAVLLVAIGLLWPLRGVAGWVTEHPEGTGPYGYWTSLVLDSAGSPRFVYRDDSRGGSLHYVRRGSSSTWVSQIVESGFDADGGPFSLVLTPAGDPRISYYKTGVGLRFAAWEGSTWTFRNLDPTGGKYCSLKIDSAGKAYISYSSSDSLKCATWNGVSWSTSTVESGGVGWWTSVALSSSGVPSISYYDFANKDLKLAQWTGTRFSTQTVASSGDVGKYSSLVLNSSGQPFISYADAGNLKLAKWNGTAWNFQTVDTSSCAYPSLVVDRLNAPSIAYEYFGTALKFAAWTGVDWSTSVVDGSNGRYPSLVLGNDGSSQIAYGYNFLSYAVFNSLYAPTALGVSSQTVNSLRWTWADNSPGETGFQVFRSSDMAPLSGDLPANTVSWTQTGLSPNTGAQILVRVFNASGSRDSQASAIRYSLANPPLGTAVISSTGTTATVGWTANGNPGGTLFRLEKSTDEINYAFVSSGTTTSRSAANLLDGTTTYFRVRAENHEGIATAYDQIVSQFVPPLTPPRAPIALEAKSRTETSITWTWVDNSIWETGYRVLRSSDLVQVSTDLAANTTEWTETGLTPNTSAQIVVRAVNSYGFSNSGPSPIRYSSAKPPTGTALVASSGTAASFSWSANGNPAGTTYRAEKSADGISFTFSSTGTLLGAQATGLTGGVTNYFRVRAENGDGVATAFDAPVAVYLSPTAPPTPPSKPAATGRTVNSVVWSWIDNSNSEEGFRVLKSSGLTPLSLDLPANSGEWAQTGLTPNTSAQVLVRAFNAYGVGDSTDSAVAYTLAAAPINTEVVSSSWTEATLRWSANGNPAGTYYRLEKSADGATFGLVSMATNTNAVATLLVDGATNYFRVRAENAEGIPTDFGDTVSIYLPRVIPPAAADNIDVAAQTAQGLTWTWWDNSSTETGFRVLRSSDLAVISSDLPANTTSWTQTLTPNTSSQIRIRAFNERGFRDSLDSPVRFSLAMPPAATSVELSSQSVHVHWSVNGNPPDTLFRVEDSAEGSSFDSVFAGTGTETSISDLMDGNTYYFRVRAENGNAIPTDYDQTVRVFLPPVSAPEPAGHLTVSNRTSHSLTWTWSDLAHNESGYRVVRDADGAVLANLPANSSQWVQEGLDPNTLSRVQIEAFNSLGVGRTARLYGTDQEFTYAQTPQNTTVTQVTPTSALVVWSPNGNPLGTEYRVALSTDQIHYSVFHDHETGLSALASELTSGITYYFRVEALNGSRVASAPDQVVSALIPEGPPPSPTFIQTDVTKTASVIDWKWSNVINAAGYRVFRVSDGLRLSEDLPAGTLRWAERELGPDVLETVRIEAFNEFGSSSTVASITTLPLPPRDTRIAETSASSIQVGWSGNGNPADTLFTAEISTDNQTFRVFSEGKPGSSAIASSLALGATYYLRVRALGRGGDFSPYDAVVSAILSAEAPPAPIPFPPAKQSAAITWRWQDVGNEQGYRILRSSDQANISGDLPAGTTAWVQTGFGPGELLGVTVQAFNSFGENGTNLSATAFPNPPSDIQLSSVTPTGFFVSWNAHGNPVSVRYSVEISTDGGAFVSVSSGTGTSASFNALDSGKTYTVRVAAHNGVPDDPPFYGAPVSATIPFGPPQVTVPAVVSKTGNAVVWGWDSRHNAEGYRVLTENGDRVLAALPAGTTMWMQTGLKPSARSALRLETYNTFGSVQSGVVETLTLANPLTNIAVASVRPTSVALSWSTNGNPGTVDYWIERATWSFPASRDFISVTQIEKGKNAAFIGGLKPGTTYYFRARSSDGGDLSAVFSVVTATGMGAPFAGSAKSGSIVWNWTDDLDGETGYRVIRVSDQRDLSGLLPPSALSWTQGNLNPNTATQVFLRVEGNFGVLDSSPSAPTYTLPKPPRNTRLTGTSYGKISLAWDTNGNPPGTAFNVYSLGGGTETLVAQAADGVAVIAGLKPKLAYTFAVRAVGPAGQSDSDQPVSAATTSDPTLFEQANPFWKIETVDSDTGAGVDATLVLDSSGSPHIFYRSGGGADLREARRGLSQWSSAVAVAGAQVGEVISAQLDRQDRAHLVYYNASNSLLNYSAWDGAQWDSESLPLETVSGPGWSYSFAGQGFQGAALRLTTEGTPVIAYSCYLSASLTQGRVSTDSYLFYETRKPFESWTKSLVQSFESTSTGKAGLGQIQLALDTTGHSHAVYFHKDDGAPMGDLIYAHQAGDHWTSEIIEKGVAGADTLVAFEMDIANRAHVVYSDSANNRIRYAVKDAGGWALETVESGRTYAFVNLTLDGHGAPHAVFSDHDSGTLRYARRAGGSWQIQTVDNKAVTGYYPSVAVDNGGDVHVAYHDFSNRQLKYAILQHRSTEARSVVPREGGRFDFAGSRGPIRIDVPAGTFAADVTLTVRSPDLLPLPNSSNHDLTPLWTGLEILATPVTNFLHPVTITLSYADVDLKGGPEHRLTVARYNSVTGDWVPVPTRVDETNKQLTAVVSDFSILQMMMKGQSLNLDEARAFPNPFRPGLPGHDQIIFDKLPGGAQVKIYTVRGEWVKELPEDGTGRAHWDARNDSGTPVASGVYFARITGSGGNKLLKIAVQR